jgi:hypothetical protein
MLGTARGAVEQPGRYAAGMGQAAAEGVELPDRHEMIVGAGQDQHIGRNLVGDRRQAVGLEGIEHREGVVRAEDPFAILLCPGNARIGDQPVQEREHTSIAVLGQPNREMRHLGRGDLAAIIEDVEGDDTVETGSKAAARGAR